MSEETRSEAESSLTLVLIDIIIFESLMKWSEERHIIQRYGPLNTEVTTE